MKLIEAFLSTEQQQNKIYSFPKGNIAVSFVDSEKKILIYPLDKNKISKKIRQYIDLLKQSYSVRNIKIGQNNTYEVRVDPTEDFGAIKDYLITSIDRDEK